MWITCEEQSNRHNSGMTKWEYFVFQKYLNIQSTEFLLFHHNYCVSGRVGTVLVNSLYISEEIIIIEIYASHINYNYGPQFQPEQGSGQIRHC